MTKRGKIQNWLEISSYIIKLFKVFVAEEKFLFAMKYLGADGQKNGLFLLLQS